MKHTFKWAAGLAGMLAAIALAGANAEARAPVALAAKDGGPSGPRLEVALGVIESYPPALLGDWRVGGVTYSAVSSTTFEQFRIPFTVGGCVQVLHPVSSTLAVGIRTVDDFGCLFHSEGHARGTLNAFPPGLTGTWTVETGTYEVLTSTLLFRAHGDFQLGGCVQVNYDTTTISHTARSAVTLSLDDCGGHVEITPTLRAAGLISARPPSDSVFGVWEIGGASYLAISGTTLVSQEHGPLLTGMCARVAYRMQGADRLALLISSKEEHECRGERDENEAYGAIETLPSDPALIGTWLIGGVNYTVTTSTLLSGGPFTPSMIVEVHFTSVPSDGGRIATRIEGKHGVSDDDRRIVKVVGVIDSRPVSPTIEGTWVVASNTYSVISTTRTFGPLNAGDCAVLFYRSVLTGTPVLGMIRNAEPERCAPVNGARMHHAYGFVRQMPQGSFVGTWLVGDHTYEAGATTVFSDANGAFMTGAFVQVDFARVDGVNQALTMTTHVPPNAGAHNMIGKLHDGISGAARVSLALGAATPTVRVDDQTYQLTEASIVIDTNGALENGQPVLINAYRDASGALVVTKITTLGGLSRAYVPMIHR